MYMIQYDYGYKQTVKTAESNYNSRMQCHVNSRYTIIYGYHYSYPNIFYPSLIQLEYFENMQIRITNLLKTSFLQSIMRLT